MLIHKNRNREKPDFANINLLGKCNADCYFCLGKDIKDELAGKNQLNVHYTKWSRFGQFLGLCKDNKIKKLYLTGQTADGLQYAYVSEIVTALQAEGFDIGVRTNGYLAIEKMDIIQQMRGGIGYSIHTLNPETNKLIMGRSVLPNWDYIIPRSGPNVRVSIVLNRYNVKEFFDLIKYIAQFKNVRYIQVRRISTDTRLDELRDDIEIYESFFNFIDIRYDLQGRFFNAEQYTICNKEVNFWRTVETTANSFNYFTDGTISDEYFIVEGYLKHRNKE